MRKNLIWNILLSGLLVLFSGVLVVPTIASASTQLIGSVTDNCTSSVSEGYVVATKFTASATDNMNVFRIRVENNVDIESAIYTDVAGTPTTLLTSMPSVSVVTGWNDISFDSTALTSGTAYWLAVNSGNGDGNSICYSVGGTSGYFLRTFNTGFPGTFPAYSSANWDIKLQGWASTTPSTATATVIASTFDDQTLILLIMLVLAFYAFIVHIHGRFYPKKLPYKV